MRSYKLYTGSILLLLAIILVSCQNTGTGSSAAKDYPITPVPFTYVKLQDNFWLPRILKNTEVTIPIAFGQSEETGRIKNFEVAGGLKAGTFCGIYTFDDSDVFKIIEGASYSLMVKPDAELEAYLDTLIYKIAAAQEEDGYLYTNRTILGDSAYAMAGPERWSNVTEHSHELYNAGHMYEAAVAHFQATGKRTFLDVAIKNANLIDREFGWGKIEKYPGHQEIEIGLVKLCRATGDQRYLDLAKFFLDVRGPGGWEYNQAHKKPVDQRDPVGHAVRALYMYSAMADVAALTGDTAYLHAIEEIWSKLIQTKFYITGGVGQSGSNEGFGADYDLPNLSAYCETCASIANVFWNERMFLLTGESKYIDVMERTMYNALLSGVSMDGNLFFYSNRLESNGADRRQEWFGCACCPSNITRFLPSVPGYIYAQRDDDIYVNLFISSETNFETTKGKIKLTQQTDYPWNGNIVLTVDPEVTAEERILVRIPGWTGNKPIPGILYNYYQSNETQPSLKINGEGSSYDIENGYMVINRKWNKKDQLEIVFNMPVRKTRSLDVVKQDKGRFVLERGPLVYCLEDADQDITGVRHVFASLNNPATVHFKENLFGGIPTVEISGEKLQAHIDGSISKGKAYELTAVPYAYWANREPGQMLVWIPDQAEFGTPAPAPTIAFLSQKSGSGAKGNLELLSDQYEPLNSNDHTVGYIHWWPANDTIVWLEYDFKDPEKVSKVRVYWFDDGPDGGCRIPASWRVLYNHGNEWKEVQNLSDYTITKDAYDEVKFEAVSTQAIKLEVKLQKEYSSGVHEWEIK
ncbi:MAG TPA: glycoside hydrolase family 127 protein [Bacteroidales bacterium]|nr:glycoside hydrolase family 127 protein [Bacteroidales bacterium]